MVLTRNSCLSENFRKSKRILRDIKHQQELRPRVSIPDYREESPDEISYFRNILKVDIKNKNSLSHKLRIRTDNSKKTYKEIHRYQLRTTANDDSKCEVNVNVDCVPSSVHESEHNNDKKRMEHLSRNNDDAVQLPHSLSVNPTVEIHESTPKQTTIFDVNKCKRTTFKRRLSSTFNKHSDLDNSQIRYDDDRRYPIRLRRRPREVYMVNTGYNSGKKANWHESLESPIRNCFKTSHHKKLEAYSKQSDTDDSDDLMNDEIKFENRKQRSMQRARLELKPINMSSNGMMTDLFNERTLARSSLADIEPMIIDKTITFDMVGGNRSCIQSLKESVVLPLIYPEVFEKLSISPPRGLLFYGSPGSGKTLMARALVNECSNSGTCKISFFMRKGADCLSKWVGESERQLRLLFDQAYRMRPSIIFFDEIDGLAPVRSARQDQIHSSIVSTLLSLIDGLDDRGQIIVIGATNRLDAIDPALRRPGRFDREFLFTLPEENVRKDILRIHTKHWQYPLSDMLVDELAFISKGFSGADLKGLVIEAGLCALRRRYPQIYRSQKKLQLNMEEIYVKEEDFKAALKIIRPSSERSALPVHCKIPPRIRVLIESQYSSVKERISQLFQESVFTNFNDPLPKSSSFNSVFKLRLHVSGYEVDNLVSGLFHDIHNVNISLFDSLYLSTNTGLSVEEKLSHLFREAHKTPKSIIFFPHLDITFHGMCLGAQNMLLSMINGTVPNSDFNVSNILIMVTLSSNVNNAWNDAEFDLSQSENMWQQLGKCFHSSTFTIDRPFLDQRASYFSQLLEQVMKPVKSDCNFLSEKELPHEEELKEVEIKPLSLSKMELNKLEFEEDNILRKFRILLRQMLANIAKDRKFQIFHKPVDESEVPDYYTIITNPMDLSTMRQKVDLYNYYTFDEFKTDLNLISANALLYNPAANSYLRDVRRHAYEFNDIAHSIFEEHFNDEFAKMVSDIHQSRVKRRYYENKKQSLAQQSSDILAFLTDLNGSKYEVNNGPLLKSQIDMYHNFYSKSSKTRVKPKAHSDTETVVTRTSLNDSVKCRSLCDVTDVDQSIERIKMTWESFKKLTKTVNDEDESAEKDGAQEDKDEALNECDTFDEEEVSSKPVIIDSGELKAVFKYSALKSDKWTIFQLEGLYCLLSTEIEKYQSLVDRTGLPGNLREIIDSYSGMIV